MSEEKLPLRHKILFFLGPATCLIALGAFSLNSLHDGLAELFVATLRYRLLQSFGIFWVFGVLIGWKSGKLWLSACVFPMAFASVLFGLAVVENPHRHALPAIDGLYMLIAFLPLVVGARQGAHLHERLLEEPQ